MADVHPALAAAHASWAAVHGKKKQAYHDIRFYHADIRPPEGLEKNMIIKVYGEFGISSSKGKGIYEGKTFRNTQCTARVAKIIGVDRVSTIGKQDEINENNLPY